MEHGGRTVLAMDCALAGAGWHRGRPLNEIVNVSFRVYERLLMTASNFRFGSRA